MQTEKLKRLLFKYLSFVRLVVMLSFRNKMGKDAAISSKQSKAAWILSDLKNKPAVNAAKAAKKNE